MNVGRRCWMCAACGEVSPVAAPLRAPARDALQVLRADHRRIDALLDECARLACGTSSHADRSGLLCRLGALLLAHAQLEQELFYPVLAAAPMAIADAHTDHDQIETLFKRLHGVRLSNSEFGARLATLSRLALGTAIALCRAELWGDPGDD